MTKKNKYYVNLMLCLCLRLLCFSLSITANDLTAVESKNYEKIDMIVGGKRNIVMPRAKKISVSRKGIIHILEASEGHFYMTALRSGLCVVDVTLAGGDHKLWYVEVRPPMTASSQSNSKAIDLTRVTEVEAPLYNAAVDVDLIEASKSETRGGKGHLAIEANHVAPTSSVQLASRLENKDLQQERKILAHPTFQLSEGVQAILKSGGERLHQEDNDRGESKAVWHEYGMTLTLTLNRSKQDLVKADVLFTLKTPTGGSNQLSLNQIQTSSILKTNEKRLLGTINLASTGEDSTADAFMAKVPIIGPLFHSKQHDHSSAVVRLWLTVNVASK